MEVLGETMLKKDSSLGKVIESNELAISPWISLLYSL